MVRTLRLALCGLLVASLVVAVAPGTAAPPPRPLCDACGDSFEETAESRGVAVTVERSTATLSVHGNGSATWVVRNRLADSGSLERLRENASLRAEIGERAMWDAEFLGASVSPSGVLTLRYREPDFAERSVAGVLWSGEFTESHGYRNLDGLGAERLVVVAPEGTHVGWTVGATASEDGRRTTFTRLDRGFLTFVPDGTAFGPLPSALALGATLAPTVGTNLLVAVAVPTAVFGLLVAGVGALLSGSDRGLERVEETAGVALAAFGVLVAGLALVVTGGVSLLVGAAAPVFGVGVTAVAFGAALSRPTVRKRATYRRLLAGAALGVLVAAGATLATVAFDQNGLTYSMLASFPALIPVFALFPAGYALGRGNRLLALGTAVVGFALSVLPFASLLSQNAQFGPLAALLFAPAYAAVVTVLGTPPLAVGMALATSSPSDGTATTTASASD